MRIIVGEHRTISSVEHSYFRSLTFGYDLGSSVAISLSLREAKQILKSHHNVTSYVKIATCFECRCYLGLAFRAFEVKLSFSRGLRLGVQGLRW